MGIGKNVAKLIIDKTIGKDKNTGLGHQKTYNVYFREDR